MAKQQPADDLNLGRRYGSARRRVRYAVVMLACVALCVWLLFFANRPARQIGQLTLTPPGGTPVALTLWAADPLIELPFTTDTKWVRLGPERWKLHGRGFGNAAGPVAVSPDLSRAVVYKSFEGGDFPALVVDLRNRNVQRTNRRTDYEKQGWTMRRWHTALESLTDAELMRELRSGDDTRFRAAREELERRPFTDQHWAMYSDAALDPNLSRYQRERLPYLLYHGDDVRYETQLRETFARTADGNPRIRLFAAWALCGRAHVKPGREFDLLATWARGPDAADAEVVAVREWWVNNAERDYWQGASGTATTLQSHQSGPAPTGRRK